MNVRARLFLLTFLVLCGGSFSYAQTTPQSPEGVDGQIAVNPNDASDVINDVEDDGSPIDGDPEGTEEDTVED